MLLPVDWFYADGIKEMGNSRDILVPLSEECRSILKSVEDAAIAKGVKIPSDFQIGSNTSEQLFKRLNLQHSMFIKLSKDVDCFDGECKPLQRIHLDRGDYRCMIHVKGLYIGRHMTVDKLISLQLRIVQIQFVPKSVSCMFPCAPVPVTSNMRPANFIQNLVPQTPQPGVMLDAPLKKGRKPKLQRQNAISEKKIAAEAMVDLDLSNFTLPN